MHIHLLSIWMGQTKGFRCICPFRMRPSPFGRYLIMRQPHLTPTQEATPAQHLSLSVSEGASQSIVTILIIHIICRLGGQWHGLIPLIYKTTGRQCKQEEEKECRCNYLQGMTQYYPFDCPSEVEQIHPLLVPLCKINSSGSCFYSSPPIRVQQ